MLSSSSGSAAESSSGSTSQQIPRLTSNHGGIPLERGSALHDPDRDRIYGAVVTRRLRAMGIRDKPIAPASPWRNGFAERLIGSIRRECVGHVIVVGEVHLRRVLKCYAD